MCAGTRISESSRLSVNSSNHSGRFRKRSSESRLSLFFSICFGFSECSFISIFELVDFFLAKSHASPRARKDYVHEVRTCGLLLEMDLFFPEFLFCATCLGRI